RCIWMAWRRALALLRFLRQPARRSPPLKRSAARRSAARCRRPGSASVFLSAATVRADKSCRPLACSRRSPSRAIRTSTTRCPATSADAGPISGSAPQSKPLHRKRDVRAILENVSRRGFIGGVAAMGGLVVGMRILPRSYAAPRPAAPATDAPRFNPTAFVAIDSTGLVTIVAHRSEMGQGIRTGLPMVVADELEADWSRVHVSQAIGDEATYGGQNTDGSRSMRHFLLPMRQMGAAVRQMLEAAAAASWGVHVSEVHARNHQIVHAPTGRVLGYGEVAAAAGALAVPQPETLKLKNRSEFRYIGKGLPIVDINDMTTGR